MEVDGGSLSALEQMEEEELHAVIAAGIESLPESLRLAVTLFYVQEMKYEEIAEVLGLPLGTVKTHLFRGRGLLQRRVLAELQEKGVYP
jgi:RNA polymerase sigma-70 factor (ECF subfamily)